MWYIIGIIVVLVVILVILVGRKKPKGETPAEVPGGPVEPPPTEPTPETPIESVTEPTTPEPTMPEKPEEVKQLFQSTILNHTPLCSYLEQKRVISIEFDNYFYPINLKLNHHSFHCHIYYPLVLSSLSRICVFAGTYKDEKKKFLINSRCEKECIRYFIQRQFQKDTTQNAFITAQVGKGIYCENKDEPKNLDMFKRCIITTL